MQCRLISNETFSLNTVFHVKFKEMEWNFYRVLKLFILCYFIEAVVTVKFQNPETGVVWKIKNPLPEPNFEPYLLSTSQLIKKEGFSVEEHVAVTEDGFILALHRIVNPVLTNSSKPPILIMHGFIIASDNWIQHGRDHDLPYLLADAGFDVWLGDFRGNCYSRNHATLSPDDVKFWDFGPHEWGYYDLPAFIEYIRYRTKRRKITYIGYSIGCGALYLMCSTRPHYNKYINGAVMLAPFVYGPQNKRIKNSYIHFVKFAINGYKQHDKVEVTARTSLQMKAVQKLTRIDAPSFKIMFLIFMDVFGEDIDQLDMRSFNQIATSFGAGTSLKAMEHMMQMYETGEFCKFDFGKSGNKIMYNSTSPPAYDLSAVSVPNYIYHGSNDNLAVIESVERLCDALPNVAEKTLVPYDKFNHIDFLVASDARTLLYNDVISVVMKISKPQLKKTNSNTERIDKNLRY